MMKKTIYKDFYGGSHSITVHYDGSATLRCHNCYGELWHEKTYKSETIAKRVLSRFNDGLPDIVEEVRA